MATEEICELVERLTEESGKVDSCFQIDFKTPVVNSEKKHSAPPIRNGVVINTMRRMAVQSIYVEHMKGLTDHSWFYPPFRLGQIEKVRATYADVEGAAETMPFESVLYEHHSLISYVHTCWVKGMGVVLSPEMFWFTICCEISRNVVDSRKKFRIVRAANGCLLDHFKVPTTVDELPDQRSLNDLAKTVCNTRYRNLDGTAEATVATETQPSAAPSPSAKVAQTSAAENRREVVEERKKKEAAASLLSTVFTKYGIPYVCVTGDAQKWARVQNAAMVLVEMLPSTAEPFRQYLLGVARLIREIGKFAYTDTMVWNNAAIQTFFSGIYWMADDCGAKHAARCFGWIKELYFRNSICGGRDVGTNDYPTHVVIVPSTSADPTDMRCDVFGYFSSTPSEDGNFLLLHRSHVELKLDEKYAYDTLVRAYTGSVNLRDTLRMGDEKGEARSRAADEVGADEKNEDAAVVEEDPAPPMVRQCPAGSRIATKPSRLGRIG